MEWTRAALLAILTLSLPPADVSAGSPHGRLRAVAAGGGVHPSPDRPKSVRQVADGIAIPKDKSGPGNP